ncbi:MAG: cobalt ECF transporter T component CbiQ [bacterium]
MTLPPWMLDRSTNTINNPPKSTKKRNPLRQAISSLAHVLEEMLNNEAIANQNGFLQMVDPRAKVIGLFALIIIITLIHNITTLIVAFAIALLMAGLSRIPAQRLWRTWLAVPLFSTAIVLPAMLNIVTPGNTVYTLYHFASAHFGVTSLTITDAGIYVAIRFILRITVCITLALLLTATTKSNRLFHGLRAFGVPKLFVMLLGMMQRYLTVFIRAAEEIHLAKISRSVTNGPLRQEQAWVAAGMGSLFRRTQSMSSAVHLAMVSRGYTGEIYLLDEPKWQTSDWGFIMIITGFAAILLVMG